MLNRGLTNTSLLYNDDSSTWYRLTEMVRHNIISKTVTRLYDRRIQNGNLGNDYVHEGNLEGFETSTLIHYSMFSSSTDQLTIGQ